MTDKKNNVLGILLEPKDNSIMWLDACDNLNLNSLIAKRYDKNLLRISGAFYIWVNHAFIFHFSKMKLRKLQDCGE